MIIFPLNTELCQKPLDKCPLVADPKDSDKDSDGVGDNCDNCPSKKNADQKDTDFDGVGDACDTDSDSDNDGIQDDRDNCPGVPNTNQHDADQDGRGDRCDDDADNDGVKNPEDNCWIVPNPGQENEDSDSQGDACDNDNDGDHVIDPEDNADNNSKISVTDFSVSDFVHYDLEPDTAEYPIEWIVRDKGREVQETANSPPTSMLSKHMLNGIDFEGTLYVADKRSDQDYVGLIFSFQVCHFHRDLPA